MMDIRALRSDADHAWALEQIAPYFDHEPAPGTPDADRFDILAILIEVYEAKRYALPVADPVDVLHFAIENLGRSQAQLARILGSRSRASEILGRQRPLTLDMIRAISAAWHLPGEALMQPYDLTRVSA